MATDAIAALRAEIAELEQQLERRRRALAILVGTAAKTKAAPASRPAGPATARPGQPLAKPMAARIQEFLTAHKGEKFAPAQIAEALRKEDRTVQPGNVQRRLRDMAKAKKVKRDNRRYSLP